MKIQSEFEESYNSSRRTSNPLKSLTDFELHGTVGRGSFAKVVLVQCRLSREFYAMKVLEKKEVVKKDAVDKVLNEARLLQSLNHPFLVQYWLHFKDPVNLYLVMELVECGDLFTHLQRRGPFNTTNAMSGVEILQRVLSESEMNYDGKGGSVLYGSNSPGSRVFALAVHFIQRFEAEQYSLIQRWLLEGSFNHPLDVISVHKNIQSGKSSGRSITRIGAARDKPDNRASTLTDFGLSKYLHEPGGCDQQLTRTVLGTPDYMAPEIIWNKPYGKAVDFWALGVVIYELFHGLRPFSGPSLGRIYENIVKGAVSWPVKNKATQLQNLVMNLLQPNVRQRFGSESPDQIKNHPWFKSMDWDQLIQKKIKPIFTPQLSYRGDKSFFGKYPDSDSLTELVSSPQTLASRRDRYEQAFLDF